MPSKQPHQDSPSIDYTSCEQLKSMKSFKGAKETDTEWLTKKNPVNQMTDSAYHPHKGQAEK